MSKTSRRMDAQTKYFFDQELERLLEESDVLYPDYKSQLVLPVAPPEGAGVNSLKYRMKDRVGKAKLITGNSRDLPRVDVFKTEFPWPVKTVGASFGYDIDEIEAAANANQPLEQDRASACREAIEEQINTVCFFGAAEVGIEGFLNNSNITPSNVPADGNGGSTTFEQKTPQMIVRDIANMVTDIITQTKAIAGVSPNAILLPVTTYMRLSSNMWSEHGTVSILNVLKQANPQITLWDWLNELETAGAGDTKRMIAYRRDPKVAQIHIPLDFTPQPEQYVGLEVEVPCRARVAGTLIRQPMAVAYRDGI